jgi:type IV pilus assembly protein PilA
MTQTLVKNRKRNRKGFTLIELIVVIAILAILAAIAIPAFSNQLNRARESTNAANIATLKSAAQICLAENGSPDKHSPVMAAQTWVADADGLPSGGADPYLAANYIDTWPSNPFGTSDNRVYKCVIAADGNVTVTFLAPAAP